ncbi:unnamed protein product [Arabidopsis arenosa]|uniref:Uncharacterized protein n=1 Tax=Arabidopsis arenosa TaxID=38785 RepID=A0A8S2A7S7_ARAAE|nr:unnamed protein product [Arabidopsis arenosa]
MGSLEKTMMAWAEEVNENTKKRGGKRKRTTKKEIDNKDEKKPAPRATKARATKPQGEPEYLDEKRDLQDLWKAVFPVGIKWKLLDALYEHNWDFKDLEEALEEGGILYGKNVYVFVNAEPQLVLYKDVKKVIPVPTVVAIESPFPPSDKIGITSIQRAAEEIIPMKEMKMDWVPYIPFEDRSRQYDRMKFQSCSKTSQRRAEFVKENVRAAKKARQDAIAARMKVIEEMSQDDRQVFQSIKFYKFYPQPPPDISGLKKLPIINRY